MQKEADFSIIEKLLYIQTNDRFYKEKFKKYQFRFPYLIKFFLKILTLIQNYFTLSQKIDM